MDAFQFNTLKSYLHDKNVKNVYLFFQRIEVSLAFLLIV